QQWRQDPGVRDQFAQVQTLQKMIKVCELFRLRHLSALSRHNETGAQVAQHPPDHDPTANSLRKQPEPPPPKLAPTEEPIQRQDGNETRECFRTDPEAALPGLTVESSGQSQGFESKARQSNRPWRGMVRREPLIARKSARKSNVEGSNVGCLLRLRKSRQRERKPQRAHPRRCRSPAGRLG